MSKYLDVYLDSLKKNLLSQHLIEDHTRTPNIALLSVSLLEFTKIDLGTSIERGSHLPSDEDTVGLPGQPEITDFDIFFNSNQDIVRFDIPVHGA